MILVGDVGGTKIDLGFVDNEIGLFHKTKKIRGRKTYAARQWSDFPSLLKKVVDEAKVDVTGISLAVAGPVGSERRILLTNLPWAIDLDHIAKAFPDVRIFIANDLEAMAAGVERLDTGELHEIQPGKTSAGNRCVIAAGTGLGEALLIWNGAGYQAVACEGSHADFGPANEEDAELLRFARQRFGHVSWERLVSGTFGFKTLTDFFISRGVAASPELLEDLAGFPDEVGIPITRWADLGEPLAQRVVEKFVTLYGAEAGNLALKCMARGGVYIGGGIAPKLLKWMQRPDLFIKGFCDKGRFSAFMQTIPIHVIVSDRAILLGAAHRAF